MTTDDNSTSAEKELLEKLLAERVELDRHIAFLQKRIGSLPDIDPPQSSLWDYGGRPKGYQVQRGEFYGMSRSQAAVALLKKTGKLALTTNEIFEALNESGLDMSGKNAFNGLYTALSRTAEVRKVAPNTWGLREWYPHLKDLKKKAGPNMNTEDQED